MQADKPFNFEFILDQGSLPLVGRAREGDLKQEASKLIKYFLAAITISEKDLWVNLSPYEKDRIIPDAFGQTEMGRDLLAQDYILKQLTASLMYPEDEVGKKFWKRVYEESAKKFGHTNIPVNTFNKVWIVPEKAVVYEHMAQPGEAKGESPLAKTGTAYVVESKLKVMLEEDYLSIEKHNSPPLVGGARGGDLKHLPPPNLPHKGGGNSEIGNQIIREIVIPQLYKEINEGQNFAQLRQVYNSLILASWYKKKLKNSILAQVYADKNKVSGISHSERSEESQKQDPSPAAQDDTNVETIYQNYLHSFKKGAYNFIKEEIDPASQKPIPRKYFSGGVTVGAYLDQAMTITNNLPKHKPGLKWLAVKILGLGNSSRIQDKPVQQERIGRRSVLAGFVAAPLSMRVAKGVPVVVERVSIVKNFAGFAPGSAFWTTSLNASILKPDSNIVERAIGNHKYTTMKHRNEYITRQISDDVTSSSFSLITEFNSAIHGFRTYASLLEVMEKVIVRYKNEPEFYLFPTQAQIDELNIIFSKGYFPSTVFWAFSNGHRIQGDYQENRPIWYKDKQGRWLKGINGRNVGEDLEKAGLIKVADPGQREMLSLTSLDLDEDLIRRVVDPDDFDQVWNILHGQRQRALAYDALFQTFAADPKVERLILERYEGEFAYLRPPDGKVSVESKRILFDAIAKRVAFLTKSMTELNDSLRRAKERLKEPGVSIHEMERLSRIIELIEVAVQPVPLSKNERLKMILRNNSLDTSEKVDSLKSPMGRRELLSGRIQERISTTSRKKLKAARPQSSGHDQSERELNQRESRGLADYFGEVLRGGVQSAIKSILTIAEHGSGESDRKKPNQDQPAEAAISPSFLTYEQPVDVWRVNDPDYVKNLSRNDVINEGVDLFSNRNIEMPIARIDSRKNVEVDSLPDGEKISGISQSVTLPVPTKEDEIQRIMQDILKTDYADRANNLNVEIKKISEGHLFIYLKQGSDIVFSAGVQVVNNEIKSLTRGSFENKNFGIDAFATVRMILLALSHVYGEFKHFKIGGYPRGIEFFRSFFEAYGVSLKDTEKHIDTEELTSQFWERLRNEIIDRPKIDDAMTSIEDERVRGLLIKLKDLINVRLKSNDPDTQKFGLEVGLDEELYRIYVKYPHAFYHSEMAFGKNGTYVLQIWLKWVPEFISNLDELIKDPQLRQNDMEPPVKGSHDTQAYMDAYERIGERQKNIQKSSSGLMFEIPVPGTAQKTKIILDASLSEALKDLPVRSEIILFGRAAILSILGQEGGLAESKIRDLTPDIDLIVSIDPTINSELNNGFIKEVFAKRGLSVHLADTKEFLFFSDPNFNVNRIFLKIKILPDRQLEVKFDSLASFYGSKYDPRQIPDILTEMQQYQLTFNGIVMSEEKALRGLGFMVRDGFQPDERVMNFLRNSLNSSSEEIWYEQGREYKAMMKMLYNIDKNKRNLFDTLDEYDLYRGVLKANLTHWFGVWASRSKAGSQMERELIDKLKEEYGSQGRSYQDFLYLIQDSAMSAKDHEEKLRLSRRTLLKAAGAAGILRLLLGPVKVAPPSATMAGIPPRQSLGITASRLTAVDGLYERSFRRFMSSMRGPVNPLDYLVDYLTTIGEDEFLNDMITPEKIGMVKGYFEDQSKMDEIINDPDIAKYLQEYLSRLVGSNYINGSEERKRKFERNYLEGMFKQPFVVDRLKLIRDWFLEEAISLKENPKYWKFAQVFDDVLKRGAVALKENSLFMEYVNEYAQKISSSDPQEQAKARQWLEHKTRDWQKEYYEAHSFGFSHVIAEEAQGGARRISLVFWKTDDAIAKASLEYRTNEGVLKRVPLSKKHADELFGFLGKDLKFHGPMDFKKVVFEAPLTSLKVMDDLGQMKDRGDFLKTARTDAKKHFSRTGGIDLSKIDPSSFRKAGTPQDDNHFKIDPATFKQLQNAPGFVPVIIGMNELTDLKAFLLGNN